MTFRCMHSDAIKAPESYCFIFTTGGEHLSIRTKTHAINFPVVPPEALYLIAVKATEPYSFIFADQCQHLTIWTKTDPKNSEVTLLKRFSFFTIKAPELKRTIGTH